MSKVKMIDLASGWKYGFPKQLPEGILEEGESKLLEWLINEGYPQSEIDDSRGPILFRIWSVDEKTLKGAIQ